MKSIKSDCRCFHRIVSESKCLLVKLGPEVEAETAATIDATIAEDRREAEEVEADAGKT